MSAERDIGEAAIPAAIAAGTVSAGFFAWILRILGVQHKVEKELRTQLADIATRTAVLETVRQQHGEAIGHIDTRVEDMGMTLGEVKLQVAETNSATRLLKQAVDNLAEQSKRNHDDLREGIRYLSEAVDRRKRPE